MIESLKYVEERLHEFLNNPDDWSSVDVNYETPRVERVWCYWGELRICLHVIHKCDDAFWHPHPWPSAIKVISGRYEMGIGGYSDNHCVMEVGPGTYYQMTNLMGYHYVKPLTDTVTSIMINGRPYQDTWMKSELTKQPKDLKSLPEERKAEILTMF